jgi:putative integral membrane protein (TIGR02587 family)
MFSLPLLCTMEVWWTGFIAAPLRLLFYVGITFVLLLGYNYYAGLHPDASLAQVFIDSIEELGIGLAVSAGILFLIGRISTAMNSDEIVGKSVVEAMTVAIGMSVGKAQLGLQKEDQTPDGRSQKADIRFGGQLIIAACGGLLFAANIAPTQEVLAIADAISLSQLLGLMALSLFMAALILYYIEFTGSDRFVRRNGFVSILIGTVSSYAIALLVAAAALWFFGRFDEASFVTALGEIIVLGFVTSLGASAGRLLVQ